MASQIASPPVSQGDQDRHDRDALAFKLLVELLSYHLASPVRWIETQNELLQQTPAIHRFLEVGPRTTLTPMAKKTAGLQPTARAPSQKSKYSFLSTADNVEDIYYEYPQQEVQHDDAQVEPQPAQPPVEPQATVAPSAAVESIRKVPSKQLALSASHILLAIVADKLRKPFDQVPFDTTIQDASGGKSTLQNEIIGILVSEFGKLPDGAEYMPLKDLGGALQGGFSGQPGKQMSALISKFINGKMPAGFNKSAIMEYLESSWGLSQTHSMVPLCLATAEPGGRLASKDSAQEFLGSFVQRYAPIVGISFTSQRMEVAGAHSSSTTTSQPGNQWSQGDQPGGPVAYQKAEQPYDDSRLQALTESTEEMTERLAQLEAELGEQFLDGVQPAFDLLKARHYDSWWNWVRADLISWLGQARDLNDQGSFEADDTVRHILNRWESSCTDILRSWSLGSGSGAFNSKMMQLAAAAERAGPIFLYTRPALGPKTVINDDGAVQTTEEPRTTPTYPGLIRQTRLSGSGTHLPFVNVQTRAELTDFAYDPDATNILLDTIHTGAATGFTYAGKSALVTGAGPDSIGAEIVKGLLQGGAQVVVTTSRHMSSSGPVFEKMYKKYGARGSKLTVVPMNQGSQQDCEALVQYIYGTDSPTGGDLDFVVPFAALNQVGEIHMLDDRAELAHRTMLVNLLRILGCIRKEKEDRMITTRPTTVILPMTCNEGTIGSDGLYAESKIALRSLFNRFYSESWADYLNVCGAAIGWTRGTGIMQPLNNISEEIEKLGVLTFTPAETAFNILALMTPEMGLLLEEQPILVDMAAGLREMWRLKDTISNAFSTIAKKQKVQKALRAERLLHAEVLLGQSTTESPVTPHSRRANLRLPFPHLPAYDKITSNLPELKGMVDLSRTVVVVGYSELGPWGSSRTRWEMEHDGKFSLAGYVEIAWTMGLIKHFSGELNGKAYVGWVDCETNDPVSDEEVPHKYHEHIMGHVGLRLIEPEGVMGYDPAKKESLHEVVVEWDLPPFECSKAAAEAFKHRHGDGVSIQSISEDEYRVVVKKGTSFMVPQASSFDTVVAGQVPKGWDPARYGIPEDIIQHVDRIALYLLCCVSEALLSAGIADPYELYQHIHVSELVSCLGTSDGPVTMAQRMFRDRYLDRHVQNDVLAEFFHNTMGAWVNMLLLSSTGPIRTPIGACATALECVDSGCEAIRSGRYKVALVGGSDEFAEEISYEFAQLKATINSTEQLRVGRLPAEMSRPTASSRKGFVESAGSGVQLLMSAELALEMGLPIYGIVAYSQMAGDQIGRSLPAPGKGVLSAARETASAKDSPLLDLSYRRVMFNQEMAEVEHWHSGQILTEGPSETLEFIKASKVRSAQHRWANDLWSQNPSMSQIKAALATWGLTIDDIQVASLHGTSTKANDRNESDVINTQMTHLGRTPGNPILVVCQKGLTGHPKGPAGAWQLNGCLQMMQTGIVPGNRNADNVDKALREFQHLVYPSEATKLGEIRATTVTSFGFGQKGAIAVVISPKYLFAAVSPSAFEDYRSRTLRRQMLANPAFVSGMLNHSVVKVKSSSPWKDEKGLHRMLLDPNCRLADDGTLVTKKPAEHPRPEPQPPKSPESTTSRRSQRTNSGNLSGSVRGMLDSISTSSNNASMTSVGIDVEDIGSVNTDNTIFLNRNFTPTERKFCSNSPNPRASYAGRWSAKEAVFKSLQISSLGPGAPMKSIEIVSESGIPKVKLHGRAQQAATSKGINRVEVSISHASERVIAIALAQRG
ncbi:hypothetical protein BDV25DRAFT_134146 [Aspergillus avenaceus]|uniref:Ketosynthase family 3 (KS3) domain-containing protein n=1 Tax=Aspergillus avenaceus TaxID=36643 RepID=A0A5N6TG04_ASPAV|nr:hypothetical protein BDV25DRAFT_134146 [Aspergillus avenaceus]